MIKGHTIPFTLTHGIANTIQPPSNVVISALKNVTIPGRTVQLVDVSLPTKWGQHDFNSILIEPSENIKLPQHLIAARTLSPIVRGDHAFIQIMNISPAATTIYKGTKVGTITPLSELLMVESIEQPFFPQSVPPNIDLTDTDLSPDQLQELLALLHQYSNLFATKDQPQGHTSIVKHTIYTEGPPICQPVRRQPVALQDAIDTEVHKMLQRAVIQQSFSPWSPPVVIV